MFQFRLRTLLLLLALVAATIATSGFGLVQLHYPRAIDNDPLIAPVRIVNIRASEIELADGRVILLDMPAALIREIGLQAGDFIDLEPDPDSAQVQVFYKYRYGICGTPWARTPFRIPLIPDDIPVNHRQSVGVGSIVANQQAAVTTER